MSLTSLIVAPAAPVALAALTALTAAAGCAPHSSPAARTAGAGAAEPEADPETDVGARGPYDHPGHPDRRADRPTTGSAAGAPGALMIDPGSADPVPVREAIAVLEPTKGNHVSGVVRFREDQRGLEVVAVVDGLTGGPHAYHVHVYGDCSAPDAESAGPHFHFTGSSFDKAPRIITGNLGELQPDGNLTTVHRVQIDAALDGPYSIIGRSVIVHEHGNDAASPPDGAAGRRLACGVIGVADPAQPPPRTVQRP